MLEIGRGTVGLGEEDDRQASKNNGCQRFAGNLESPRRASAVATVGWQGFKATMYHRLRRVPVIRRGANGIGPLTGEQAKLGRANRDP